MPNQHLWQTEETGPLDTAGYPLQKSHLPALPSLSGPSSPGDMGFQGIGGSNPDASLQEAPKGIGFAPEGPPRAQPKPTEVKLSYEQMKALASAMEEDYRLKEAEARLKGRSSVQHVLERSQVPSVGPPPLQQPGSPQWLDDYMATVNDQSVPEGVDGRQSMGYQSYTSERDLLQQLKQKQRSGSLQF